MIFLKVVFTDFKNESRDKRELEVAKDLGYEVIVLAKTWEKRNYKEFYDGYTVYRISTRRFGNLNFINRGLALLDYFFKIYQLNASIVSGHDYIATFVAYIANVFKRKKAKIIYDSHEFELYRNAPRRTKFQQRMIKLVEGFLLHRVDLTVMVGNKIADRVQEIYGLKKRPIVVRNIPNYWHLKPERSEKIRKQFLEKLGLSDSGVLLMYHGCVTRGRGIECAIQTLSVLPEVDGLIVLGDEGIPGMIERLREMAQKANVLHRVLFHQAVTIDKLKDYIGAVDVELVLGEGNVCLSYAYALPNKFFESIQACVPMICSDLPEMGKLVNQYEIGCLVKENDVQGVANAVLIMQEDKEFYARLKKNMEKAKEEFFWEKERLKLKAAIQEMMGELNNAI